MKKVALILIALLLVSESAGAHAVVFPQTSRPGAYEKYTIRVPNEKNVETTRIRIEFPEAVHVISFSDVPGWPLEIVRDSAQRITAAIWTGTLPPQRFIELPFIAVNPKTSAAVAWPIHQTYSDGETVDWTGPADSKTPASVTDIEVSEGASYGVWLAAVAVLLSLGALGLALRRS